MARKAIRTDWLLKDLDPNDIEIGEDGLFQKKKNHNLHDLDLLADNTSVFTPLVSSPRNALVEIKFPIIEEQEFILPIERVLSVEEIVTEPTQADTEIKIPKTKKKNKPIQS